MKTKKEIIDETVEFYSTDPSRRSYNQENNMCMYNSPDGNKCAVGRCLKDDYDTAEIENSNVNTSILLELKEEYKGHELYFWRDLQRLHDATNNWTKESLSELGKKHVKKLYEEYT